MRNLTHVVNVTAFVLLVGFALLTAQTTYGDTFRLPTGGTITGKLVATSGPTKCYKTTNGGITCGSQQNSFAVALAYARGK